MVEDIHDPRPDNHYQHSAMDNLSDLLDIFEEGLCASPLLEEEFVN